MQTRPDRQTTVRDVMDERVIEPEVPIDRAHISEVCEATEGARDVGRVTVREECSAPNVERLADHRRALEELAIGRKELVESGAYRRLHGHRKIRFAGSACPRQLDDE